MAEAVAVYLGPKVLGDVLFRQRRNGVVVLATFTRLPPGQHGFHIHKAGDLRGEGCLKACDHWHKGRATTHGGPPTMAGPRHTGDLGNIEMPKGADQIKKEYFLRDVVIEELLGRSIIVHEDPDDLGKGPFEDSQITGHSGKRIACGIIGRVQSTCGVNPKSQTRKSRS